MIFLNPIRTEKYLAMNTNTQTEEKSDPNQRSRQLPDKYICIAEDESAKVIHWLNGAGSDADKEIAEVHLRLCFHCQEVVVHMMKTDEEFKKRAGRCLHLARRQDSQRNAARRNGTKSQDLGDPSKSLKARGGI